MELHLIKVISELEAMVVDAWAEVAVQVLMKPPEAFGADRDHKASRGLASQRHRPGLIFREMFATDQQEVGRELRTPLADLPHTAWDCAH